MCVAIQNTYELYIGKLFKGLRFFDHIPECNAYWEVFERRVFNISLFYVTKLIKGN